MNARESEGRLSGDESMLMLEENLSQGERDRLEVLRDKLLEAERQVGVMQEKVMANPGNFMWVQLYAEWWGEAMADRKSIHNIMARAK